MHEKAEGAMFNYNNSLVVVSLFLVPVARESRGLTLALCARKLHVASLPITAYTDNSNELAVLVKTSSVLV